MAARPHAHRFRTLFGSDVDRWLEAFVLYWFLPSVLVIGYLWHATEASR